MPVGGHVARLAVHQSVVAKIYRRPVLGDMAVGALPIIMIERCITGVAGDTIGQTIMLNLCPGIRNVAVRALAAPVPGGPGMARFAVGVGDVVKMNVGPVRHRVAA